MEYKNYLGTKHWKDKRRDKLAIAPVCRICKATEGLNIHHKFYCDKKGQSNLFRERTVDLITLCASCHKLWHLYCHEKRDVKGKPNYSRKIMAIRELMSYGVVKPWAFRLSGMNLWDSVRGKAKKIAMAKKLGVFAEV